MSVTVPFSTCGSSASCWALLKRWISSMNRTVRAPSIVTWSWAPAIAARTSATPLMTADIVVKRAPIASARSRARVVLPLPGGPHSSSEPSWPRSTERRRGPRSPTRCSCPTNSSSVRGRIRAARGCRPAGGANRPGALVGGRRLGMSPSYAGFRARAARIGRRQTGGRISRAGGSAGRTAGTPEPERTQHPAHDRNPERGPNKLGENDPEDQEGWRPETVHRTKGVARPLNPADDRSEANDSHDVDQDEQDGQHAHQGATDTRDPAYVADDVGVLLFGSGREQASLATSSRRGARRRDVAALPLAGPGAPCLGGPLLGEDLGFQLGCAGLLGRGQRPDRPGWASRPCSRRRASAGPAGASRRALAGASSLALGHGSKTDSCSGGSLGSFARRRRIPSAPGVPSQAEPRVRSRAPTPGPMRLAHGAGRLQRRPGEARGCRTAC